MTYAKPEKCNSNRSEVVTAEGINCSDNCHLMLNDSNLIVVFGESSTGLEGGETEAG
jgi:hypothetical protein